MASIAPGDAFLRFELLSWNEREPVGQEIFSLSTDGGSRLVVMSKSGSRGGRAYQFDGRTWALIAESVSIPGSSLPTSDARLFAPWFSRASFDAKGRVLLSDVSLGLLREAPDGRWDWLTPGWPTSHDGTEADPERDPAGKPWSWPRATTTRWWDGSPSAVDVGDELVIAQDASIVIFDPRTGRTRPVAPP